MNAINNTGSNLIELSEDDMLNIDGGMQNMGAYLFGATAAGALGGAASAAGGAVTVGALGVPALAGAALGASGFLLSVAAYEGYLTVKTVWKYGF